MLRALPLGKLLVSSGLLTPEALDGVLEAQKADGRRLGELLAERGLVPAHQLAQFLSHQLSCPWVSLQRTDIATSVIELLPKGLALQHHVVPVHLRSHKGEKTLYIATDDPTDDLALAECARAVGMPVKPMVALSSEIRAVLERVYGEPSRELTPRPPPVPAGTGRSEKPPAGSSRDVVQIAAAPSGPVLRESARPKPPPPPKTGLVRESVRPPEDTRPDATVDPNAATRRSKKFDGSNEPREKLPTIPPEGKTSTPRAKGQKSEAEIMPVGEEVDVLIDNLVETPAGSGGAAKATQKLARAVGTGTVRMEKMKLPPPMGDDAVVSSSVEAADTQRAPNATLTAHAPEASRPPRTDETDTSASGSIAPPGDAPSPRTGSIAPKSSLPPPPARAPRILVLNAPPRFRDQVTSATSALGAAVVSGDLMRAAELVSRHEPCAIVVTDEVYAFERSGLSKLALESDALLVVWSDDVEGKQLEPLLKGAVKRWRRSSYAKGTILEGRYELHRDLGGAFAGSRWEVKHARTGRRSFLKIGVRTASDESDADAVLREEHALSRVHHPGAVDLRDAGNTEIGDPYVVVEMIEGRTLEGLVAARGALWVDDGAAVIRELAEILAAAHAASVTNNAVRPKNVILVRDGYGYERVKLVHWESARVTEGEIDPKSDLAGLGECAFHVFFGRARAQGETVPDSHLGEELATIITRALELLPGYDYESVRELIAELDAAVPRAKDGIHLLHARPERRYSDPPKAMVSSGSASEKAERDRGQTGPPAPSELRRYPRAPYRTPVRVEVPGVGAVDGRSEDISVSGLFIVARTPIAVGAEITIRFALPIDGKVVSETGVVKWTRATKEGEAGTPFAIGVELTSSSADRAKQIERYVSYMTSDPGA